ncbi:MAG: hypothetical protein ACOYKE_02440 [Ferruginibacter sp.]
MDTPYFNALSDEDKAKVLKSIDTLSKDNGDIVDQLERLAILKDKKPFVFKLAIHKLKSA